jgi:diguanylate cyclase (GGDEF)-like protein
MHGDAKTEPEFEAERLGPEQPGDDSCGSEPATKPRLGQTELLSPQEFLRISDREARRALRYGRPLSVAMVTIDGFRLVRESAGADAANQVAKSSIRRMVDVLRGPDAVARLGPGEFGLMLPETSLQQASIAAERLRLAFESAPLDVGGVKRNVSVSIGVAALSPRTRNPKSFLMAACAELRRARQQGPGTICTAPPETTRPTQRGNRKIH